jgi:hypothetical protein
MTPPVPAACWRPVLLRRSSSEKPSIEQESEQPSFVGTHKKLPVILRARTNEACGFKQPEGAVATDSVPSGLGWE